MRTEYHKISDANHIGWINLIQSNTTHCAKLGLMRMQESYIDTFTAQVAAPGLFGGFSFHGLKKLKVGGIHETTPQLRVKNTVKQNSKRESSRKSSNNQRLFPGANLVLRPAWHFLSKMCSKSPNSLLECFWRGLKLFKTCPTIKSCTPWIWQSTARKALALSFLFFSPISCFVRECAGTACTCLFARKWSTVDTSIEKWIPSHDRHTQVSCSLPSHVVEPTWDPGVFTNNVTYHNHSFPLLGLRV